MLKYLTALACLLVVGSCDNSPSGDKRLGVRLDGSSVTLYYLPCDGEELSSATLFQSDGDNVTHDSGDVVIWERKVELSALSEGGLVLQTTQGEVSLDADTEYFVEVETSRNVAGSHRFHLSDFSADAVRVNGRNVSEAEFTRAAAKSC